MDNNAVAKVFADVAVLMQAKGENVFKVRAHSKASDAIKSLPFPITGIVEDTARMRKIPSFGEAIVAKAQELVQTGKLGLFEELLDELPDGVLELVQIPGIGPKTAVTAANVLGISTFQQLAYSIESGEFQSLPRISKKGAQQILRHVQLRIEQGDQIGIGPATQLATDLITEMKSCSPGEIDQIEVAGSVRRAAELVGDINFVCSVKNESSVAPIIEAFTTLSNVQEVTIKEQSAARFTDTSGLGFSIKVVTAEAWAGALVYATGSIAHGTRLEDIAKAKGFKFTSDGLFDSYKSD
jgi:DNA polymerase (family 10)